MKFILLFTFLSLPLWADTYEYQIEGMTCGSCKNMVKSAVCAVPGVKTCDVQVGSMKLSAEEGQTLNQTAITKALDDLNKKNNSEYKITASKPSVTNKVKK